MPFFVVASKLPRRTQNRLASKSNEAGLNRIFIIVFLHQRDVMGSAKAAFVGI